MDALPGFNPPQMERTAVFSPDQRYRYTLTRYWGTDRPLRSGRVPLHPRDPILNMVMLNPSTADEHQEDATIRRVIEFARREGYCNLIVTNLFALRSTDAKALYTAPYPGPIGPENLRYLHYCAEVATAIWVGWGEHGEYMSQGHVVAHLLGEASGLPLLCLGRNAGGMPGHPLYLPGKAPLQVYQTPKFKQTTFVREPGGALYRHPAAILGINEFLQRTMMGPLASP